MSLARQNKGPRKDGPHSQASPTQPRRGGGPGGGGAWRGPHNNPSIMQNYSPRAPPAMMPQVQPPPQQQQPSSTSTPQSAAPQQQQQQQNPAAYSNDTNSFAAAVAAGANGASHPSPAPPSLPPGNLIGSLIVVTTHSGIRHEGTLAPNDQPLPGITLKDAKDLVNPGAALMTSYFIPTQQISNWKRQEPGQSAPLANGTKALDNFRTDRDISGASSQPRERELKAWNPDGAPAGGPGGGGLQGPGNYTGRDTVTFGSQVNGKWDQFAANEKLFGVSTDYSEEMYTTKLDRSTSDYKERERKAQQIAAEIEGSTAANPHLREERNQADEGGDEEAKYGAVQRGPNAYIPPAARRSEGIGAATPKDASKATTPTVVTTPPVVPKVSVNGPESTVDANGTKANGDGEQKAEDPAVVSFRSFVSSERQRITQKKNAMSRIERDKRLADLVSFGSNFKLNQPMPADLVPILAKDEKKQKAILEKSNKDAEDAKARKIGTSIPPSTGAIPVPVPNPVQVAPQPSLAAAKVALNRNSIIQPIPPFKGKSSNPPPTSTATSPTPTAGASSANAAKPGSKRPAMVIAKIPPFDPSKRRGPAGSTPATESAATPAATNGSTPAESVSGAAGSRLNVNASTFRPNPTAPAFKPGGPSPVPSPSNNKPAETTTTPNPYFGVRQIKKGATLHVKDDFNPFKFNKVSDAATVPSVWPFTGRRFMATLPPVPHPPPQVPHHPPPPSFEDDSANQAAQVARMSYPMMFYPYPGYPGQQAPPPHMMPPNQPPPAGYMGSPYMHPMAYPQGVPQNGAPMYPPPPMPGMPPQQGYMPPPPPQGAYQPNGGPRGSMPPTPIPQHAYAAAYHQSPQMGHQHALPYQMMMPPQGPGVGVPPHAYEQQPQGPGPMGVGQH